MGITQQGIEGEKIARELLLENVKPQTLTQMDWFYFKDGKWFSVEVKHKDMFQPPPFVGQGLDKRQLNYRLKFYKDTGIRCLFLVIDKTNGDAFAQWIDVLENKEYFDTKNGIRIYNINGFKKM